MSTDSAAQAANGKGTSGDADVDAISTPDPRADGNGADSESPNAPRAQRLGWQPFEKYRGPKDKWLDADAFIDKVEGEVPVLRERLRFQDKFIQEQQSKLSTIEERTKKQEALLEEMATRQRQQDDRGFSRLEEEIETEMDSAAAEADTDRYQKAKKRLNELRTSRKPAPAKTKEPDKPDGGKKPPSPEVQQWVSDNAAWFNANDADDEASQFAILRDSQLGKKYPDAARRLAKVREEFERRFPVKFYNESRRNPPVVNSPSGHGSNRGGGKRPKTVADLDADQKAALAMIKRRDPKFKDEDYLKNLK